CIILNFPTILSNSYPLFCFSLLPSIFFFFFFLFFFNDTATTEIYTLSYTTLFRSGLQFYARSENVESDSGPRLRVIDPMCRSRGDRKSTRLNSSHVAISYAVFCLKKKKKKKKKKRNERKHDDDNNKIYKACKALD